MSPTVKWPAHEIFITYFVFIDTIPLPPIFTAAIFTRMLLVSELCIYVLDYQDQYSRIVTHNPEFDSAFGMTRWDEIISWLCLFNNLLLAYRWTWPPWWLRCSRLATRTRTRSWSSRSSSGACWTILSHPRFLGSRRLVSWSKFRFFFHW